MTASMRTGVAVRKEADEMPLTIAAEGEPFEIKKVGGREETRQFLENLGFVTGAVVTVISKAEGNVIVNIKNSRVALGSDMAARILV